MKFKIGVFGSAIGENFEMRKAAWAIGFNTATNGGVLITGGCGGLPHEAARGATQENGLVIGISPAMNLKEHIEKYGFPADSFYTFIFTGMERKGRNIITLRTCDAAIFISGRTGTLNEFTIARDEATEEFVIGILKNSGGIIDKILEIEDFVSRKGKGSKATFVIHDSPYDLVEEVFNQLNLNRQRKEE